MREHWIIATNTEIHVLSSPHSQFLITVSAKLLALYMTSTARSDPTAHIGGPFVEI